MSEKWAETEIQWLDNYLRQSIGRKMSAIAAGAAQHLGRTPASVRSQINRLWMYILAENKRNKVMA